jgi:hypothetical protein
VQNCNFACCFIWVLVSHIKGGNIFGPEREEAKGYCIKKLYDF